jgi:hypothetical protein
VSGKRRFIVYTPISSEARAPTKTFEEAASHSELFMLSSIVNRMARGFASLLALVVLLVGCSYTFIPLTPKPLDLPPAIIVNRASVLTRSQDRIVLRVKLDQVPKEGYLSASLYFNDDRVSEDSKLIDAPSEVEFDLSDAKLGAYRAYLFWEGAVVRQFEFVLE